MGSKRKNRNSNAKQAHPQKTFQDYVADATLAKFSDYINGQINRLGQNLYVRQLQVTEQLKTRIVSLEEIAMELNPKLTKDDLAERIAVIEDRNEGFERVETAEKGDRVRVEIKTRTKDQTEYQGSSRLQIENIGAGNVLGLELENFIVSMKSGESKEVAFGKDASMNADIRLQRVSRKKPEPKAAEPAPSSEQTPLAAPQTQETANASANAG